jgi:hypothetical protein
MIEFKKSNNGVIVSYSSDTPSPEWVYHEIDRSGEVTIAKAFSFTKNELLTTFDQNHEHNPIEFQAAEKQGEHFCFPKNILSIDHDLYIHEDIKLSESYLLQNEEFQYLENSTTS